MSLEYCFKVEFNFKLYHCTDVTKTRTAGEYFAFKRLAMVITK